jgi:NAD(P)-dependent dehydrogenase (short-subunit alcohol dehydrogenase family)
MADWLKERVSIITGSGRGIGKAIALGMAKEGARVVTNDCDPDVAEAVAKEITDQGGKAISFCGDISVFDVARELVQTAVDNFGRLDILVNNAGIAEGRNPIWEMTEESWDRMMAVHLKGSFNCTRHAVGIMKQQGWGRIINTTSPARLGLFESCHYSTAKAGLLGLTRAVALEVGNYGITCNAYAPVAATKGGPSEEAKARLAEQYKSGILTKELYERRLNPPPPEAIPPFIIYLCTDEAANISGQVFYIRARQEIHIFKEETKNFISKDGFFTVEELVETVPKILLHGIESKLLASS